MFRLKTLLIASAIVNCLMAGWILFSWWSADSISTIDPNAIEIKSSSVSYDLVKTPSGVLCTAMLYNKTKKMLKGSVRFYATPDYNWLSQSALDALFILSPETMKEVAEQVSSATDPIQIEKLKALSAAYTEREKKTGKMIRDDIHLKTSRTENPTHYSFSQFVSMEPESAIEISQTVVIPQEEIQYRLNITVAK